MIRRLAALVLAATLALPVAAQEASVVGTSVLGGKRVELLSDNTWRYAVLAQNDDAKCVPINTVLTFCGTIFDWRPLGTTGTDFTRQFRHDSRSYAGIIHEELGAADGMDMEFMRNAVIEIAAMATGTRPEDVAIHDVRNETVDGQPGETIVYGANIQGLDVMYQNTIVNAPHHNLQFVVWTIGADLTETNVALHKAFLDAQRITFPEATQ